MRKYVLICISFLMAIGLVSTRPLVIYADSGFDYTNYYELDYIKPVSNGAYIDTGLSSTNNYDFEISFKYSTGRLFGSSNGTYWGFADGGYRTPSKYGNFTSGFTTGNDYIISGNKSSFYINGNQMTLSNDSNSGGGNLCLFLYNNNSESSNLRIYYAKFSLNNSLAAYFVPAKRKSDNVVGMYDIVSGSFKTNSGSSSFEYGSIVSITQYTITTSVSPSGSGTVTGGGTYDSGSVISLVASANNGYQFSSWSDGDTSNPRSLTVTIDQSITAIFTAVSPPSPTQYTITTSVSPSGSGTVTGGGTYDSGSSVTLTASANNGYEFNSWSDGVTTNPRTITVSSDQSFTALFTSVTPSPTQYTITTSVSPSGSGTVSGGGTYQYGSVATLTANANSGYQFASWSDGVTTNPRSLEVTSNLNLVAYFTQDLSNQIVLGTNINSTYFLDDENQFVTGWQQNGNFYSASTYSQDTDYRYAQFQFDVILNKEYTGYLSIFFHIYGHTDWAYTIIVYVNGSSGTGYFNYRGRDNVGSYGSIVIIDSYNTNNLIVKESTANALYEGTQESIETNNDFNDSNDDFNSMASDMFQLENSFNQDLNDSLDEIDTDFSFDNAFGSKFLYSASFVKDEFDFLTQNNAFGSLLSFSLLLGLGLLILGKIL